MNTDYYNGDLLISYIFVVSCATLSPAYGRRKQLRNNTTNSIANEKNIDLCGTSIFYAVL